MKLSESAKVLFISYRRGSTLERLSYQEADDAIRLVSCNHIEEPCKWAFILNDLVHEEVFSLLLIIRPDVLRDLTAPGFN